MSELPKAPSFRQRSVESARLVRLAVRLTWRASPWLVDAILALILVQAFLPVLSLGLTKGVVDRAALSLGLAGQAGSTSTNRSLVTWILLAAAVLALGRLIGPVAETCQGLAGDRVTGYLTEQLIAAASRWQGLARFEDSGLADDLARARRYAPRGGIDILMHGAPTLIAPFSAVALAPTLARLHPLIPLVILLAAIPQMAREREYCHRTGSHLYVHTAESRCLSYFHDMLLTAGPAKDVRLYGLGPFFQRKYEESFARATGMLDLLRRQLGRQVSLASAVCAGRGRRLSLRRLADRKEPPHAGRSGALRWGGHHARVQPASDRRKPGLAADRAAFPAQPVPGAGGATRPHHG